MKLNTDRINAFFQTAIDKSFNRAANNLCISQSALSQRILKLEEELETTLLVRNHSGVTLTEAGTLLFNYILEQQNKEDELLESLRGGTGEIGGVLRIASFSSVLRSVIMPALQPLIQSVSSIQVEFFSRELRELPYMLESGEVDLIVSDDSFSSAQTQSLILGFEKMIHIRHIDSSKNINQGRTIFLDHDAEDMTTFNFLKQQGVPTKDIQRRFYDDVYGLLDGVKLGFGEAIISKHIVPENEPIEVVSHKVQIRSPVVLYLRKNRYQTLLLKEAIKLLKENTPSYLERRFEDE